MEEGIEKYLSEIKNDWFEAIKIKELDKTYTIKLIKAIEHYNLVKRIVSIYGSCSNEAIKDAIESYWIDKFFGEAIIKDNDKQRESKN
jgi:hypothetical protein